MGWNIEEGELERARDWQQEEVLDKSAQGEAEMAAFDRFSKQLLHCTRERIQVVNEGLKLNGSEQF